MESRRTGWLSHSRALTAQEYKQYYYIAGRALIALNEIKHANPTHQLQNQVYLGDNVKLKDVLDNTPGGVMLPYVHDGTLFWME